MESGQRSVGFERQVRSIVIDLLVLLADGDYESIMERCGYSLLDGDDLWIAVEQYGRTVVAPPADYRFLRACELKGRAVPTWHVDADVWTDEEGRSDLTLEMTIEFEPSGPVIGINSLHVL
ncbi:MAG: hypothetical protein HC861_04815 [Rhodospirillaceae bacterium]|nr:hypothetical protein [Rhodospirillaceae bacterium]